MATTYTKRGPMLEVAQQEHDAQRFRSVISCTIGLFGAGNKISSHGMAVLTIENQVSGKKLQLKHMGSFEDENGGITLMFPYTVVAGAADTLAISADGKSLTGEAKAGDTYKITVEVGGRFANNMGTFLTVDGGAIGAVYEANSAGGITFEVDSLLA